MKVLSYGRQWIDDDDIDAVVKVLRGDWLTMGPTVAEFEKALADYAGVKHAVAFANGTAALHGAMAAAGLGEGDFELTTAMTFAATSNAALYVGAVPVFADIDPDTLCLDPAKAEARLKEKRCKVITPVSFAGYPFDIQPFKDLAKRYGAVLIEDASHAWGGSRDGGKIGHDADMTTLSFHPVKHITTAEGGAVLTQNDEYARRLRLFRNHGVVRDAEDFKDEPDGPWHSEMQTLGYNYRLSEIGCALGLSQMKHLDSFVARRREIAALYREKLDGVPGLTLPANKEGHAYHLFPIQVVEDQRRPLFEHLWKQDIRLQVHYRPVPLHPYYRERFGYKDGDFPEAERYYRQAISLPIFPLMEDEDVCRVASCIREFLR
ncbi:MAG: UDP-4-amino-4,6-dideoxy-N-acetyl-beta-L-altrosamine transaminase [Synergistaceae bacterium]|nr:UDP-4-amino-4,6-dideoxy-N-acetyl-beta-L-altrosamine transaminase [Synergistaceae bacterium]